MQRFVSNGLRLALLLGIGGCATTQSTPPSAAPLETSSASLVAAAPEPEILVRVGSETITIEDFQREMQRRGGLQPGHYATAKQRRALLDEMVRNKAVIARARAEGIDKQPEIKSALEKLLLGLYLRAYLEPELEGIEVSSEEVRAAYEARQDEYMKPERRRIAWIFFRVGTKAEAEQVERVRGQAEESRAEAMSLPSKTRNFGEVAQRLSNDASTRYVGGELGWIYLDQAKAYRWGPEVVENAFALESPGSLSPVFRHEKGFYVLKLVDVEEAAPTPIERLSGGIRARILKERRDVAREAFYENLLADMPPSIDEGRLAAIEPLSGPEQPESTPPPMPND